jgi:hypothetical protein
MVIHEQSKSALVLPAQQQVKYVLDFETGKINQSSTIYQPYGHKYHFQIDSRGNVKIQHICEDWRGWNYPGQTRLSIVDNIPIPSYLIDMLKELISFSEPPTYSSGFWDKNVINVFNKIKSGLKELANNPLDAADIKSQLGFSMNKNEILQNELKEMEQKCKNIQAAYVDTLKDNEKIKQEKAALNEKLKKEIDDLKATNTKITATSQSHAAAVKCLLSQKLALLEELEKSRTTRHYTSEFEPEFGPEFEPEFGDKFKTDYTHTHSLQDCYHNPGGATIYTKANAMNRMVFNSLLGIYEPGDEK